MSSFKTFNMKRKKLNRRQIINRIQESFEEEDEKEPFANRGYVEETIRIFDLLKNGVGDFDNNTDRATFDIVMDIIRYFGVDPYDRG